MHRDTHRAPRRQAGRAGIPFAFVLTLLAAFAIAFAPGCGQHSEPSERTGSTSQALGTASITVLHTFLSTSADGQYPTGNLVRDSAGTLYGTTQGGGSHSSGALYKITSSGTESLLHSFCSAGGSSCTDGISPSAGLVRDSSGNLYGTTEEGGGNGSFPYGGVVFKLTSGGSFSVLYSFCATGGSSCTDGRNPVARLVVDSSGNLYGTTQNGGANGGGTVFKVTSSGVESVLYSFCATGGSSCTDGKNPVAGLLLDASGNLYGTAENGGAHAGGTAFKLTSGGSYSVLYSFCAGSSCSDGETPEAGLVMDSGGNLFGTAQLGGPTNNGVVFKIASGGSYSVVHGFCAAFGCTDGANPVSDLIMDASGTLYGTTETGFESGSTTLGAAFSLTPSGAESLLYSFCGSCGSIGEFPMGGLLMDSAGNLYGTTANGGTTYGTVFELSLGIGKQLGPKCPYCDTASAASTLTNDGSITAGEPIDVGSGNVTYSYTDYTTAGQNPLAFRRFYNSLGNAPGLTTLATSLGVNWRSNFDRTLQLPSSTSVIAERLGGRQVTFSLVGSTWTPDSDVDMTLAQSGSSWTLTDHDGTAEAYTTASGGASATLNSITARNGYAQTLSYTSGQLTSVSDSYSRTLTLAYNSNGTLHTVATPDSTTITYGTTSATGGFELTSVSFPTSPAQVITYNYALSGQPFALTSVTDEDSNTWETWTYDSQGRGLTNQQGSGANLTTLVYNADGSRTITNPLGVTDTYSFTVSQGVPKVTGISRASTSTTAAATEAMTYDTDGFLASLVDWNGNTNSYTNDSHGDPTTIVEASGSAVSRTTTIAYNSTFPNLPATITTPGVTATFTYDSSGEELTRTLTDTTSTSTPYSTNGQTRTWTNTWSSHLLATAKTPNNNTTTFGYTGGALTSVTDALSHVTSISSVTGGGRPLTIVDPNSVTTTLTYDARQRLLTSAITMSAGTRTTTYAYTKAGDIAQVTLPDSSLLAYTRDAAHRITKVTDALSNTTNYTLDALGDRTALTINDSSSGLYAQHGGTFDALGRLLVDTGGRSQTTTSTFDPNGNALTVTDGNSHTTTRTFDALNRLSTSTDANSGVTTTSYDAHDRVTNVQDALSHSTSYVFDGFGDVIQQTSPDTGTTVYTYDADGNLTKQVNAASVETDMAYDALDRMTSKTFPADSTQNVYLAYDSTGWPYGDGVGRLTGVADAAGYEYFGYDERGEITFQRRTYASTNYDIYVSYDAAGRYNGSAYPSNMFGGVVARNAAGQATQVSEFPTGSGSSSTVAWTGNTPFGPINYVTYGNSVTGPIQRDKDYNIFNVQLATASSGGTTLQNLGYTFDGANNITAISDSVHAANAQTLGYDVINRLTSASSGTGGYGSLAWAYDKVGNLTSSTVGSTTTTYALTSGTNRLASYTQGSTTTVSTNSNGNITSIPPAIGGSASTFSYTVANRLSGVTGGGSTTASYVYGFDGHRVAKTVGSTTTLYLYGVNGELLEEKNLTSGAATDYIYLDGRPLGIFVPGSGSGTLYYVHPDNLGTPQFVTDGSQATVWSTSYQPYGKTGTVTGSITQDIRLPGQYGDSETGFSQNWNRDYMPNLGRYLEADPIGLAGGVNSYLYAQANPLEFTDPSGEAPQLSMASSDLPSHSEMCMAGSSYDSCLGRCYPILERPKPYRWNDRNQWNFDACMKECLGGQ